MDLGDDGLWHCHSGRVHVKNRNYSVGVNRVWFSTTGLSQLKQPRPDREGVSYLLLTPFFSSFCPSLFLFYSFLRDLLDHVKHNFSLTGFIPSHSRHALSLPCSFHHTPVPHIFPPKKNTHSKKLKRSVHSKASVFLFLSSGEYICWLWLIYGRVLPQSSNRPMAFRGGVRLGQGGQRPLTPSNILLTSGNGLKLDP